MAKEKNNLSFQSLIKMMGTTGGTIITFATLIGIGFAAGVHYNDFKKNIEILEIKKDHFLEIQDLSNEINLLKIENRELNINITDYEKEK